jgi:hypothetical protein
MEDQNQCYVPLSMLLVQAKVLGLAGSQKDNIKMTGEAVSADTVL